MIVQFRVEGVTTAEVLRMVYERNGCAILDERLMGTHGE